jgi:imidazole glycerol phosphate synthase subunit HisF
MTHFPAQTDCDDSAGLLKTPIIPCLGCADTRAVKRCNLVDLRNAGVPSEADRAFHEGAIDLGAALAASRA